MEGNYGCPFVPSREMHLISKQEFEYFFHFFWPGTRECVGRRLKHGVYCALLCTILIQKVLFEWSTGSCFMKLFFAKLEEFDETRSSRRFKD